jgi:hypothetical protein
MGHVGKHDDIIQVEGVSTTRGGSPIAWCRRGWYLSVSHGHLAVDVLVQDKGTMKGPESRSLCNRQSPYFQEADATALDPRRQAGTWRASRRFPRNYQDLALSQAIRGSQGTTCPRVLIPCGFVKIPYERDRKPRRPSIIAHHRSRHTLLRAFPRVFSKTSDDQVIQPVEYEDECWAPRPLLRLTLLAPIHQPTRIKGQTLRLYCIVLFS